MRKTVLRVARGQSGWTLGTFLQRRLNTRGPFVRNMLQVRNVKVNGRVCTDANIKLFAGQLVEVTTNKAVTTAKDRHETLAAKSPDTRRTKPLRPKIIYSDEHILVVDKPPGITTVRHADERREFGKRALKYLPPTLVDQLQAMLAERSPRPGRIRAVHRLDKETSGLLVLARTTLAERKLGIQLRQHEVERTYLALVRGRANSQRVESYLIPDRGDGRRGSTLDRQKG